MVYRIFNSRKWCWAIIILFFLSPVGSISWRLSQCLLNSLPWYMMPELILPKAKSLLLATLSFTLYIPFLTRKFINFLIIYLYISLFLSTFWRNLWTQPCGIHTTYATPDDQMSRLPEGLVGDRGTGWVWFRRRGSRRHHLVNVREGYNTTLSEINIIE